MRGLGQELRWMEVEVEVKEQKESLSRRGYK